MDILGDALEKINLFKSILMKDKRRVVVIGGPTGSGESTITNALIKLFPNYTRLVTATTRPMRGGEKDGVDYYFFSKEQFLKEKELGNILESTYIANRDIYYGSYRHDLEKKLADGKIVIVNPDIIGAQYYKKNYDALTLFIEPESIEVLASRIKKRSPSISAEELNQRLENARQELTHEKSFYDFIIRNEDGKLDEAIRNATVLIEQYEREE